MPSLLGKARVIDDPRFDRPATLDRRQHKLAHPGQHRSVRPRCIPHKMRTQITRSTYERKRLGYSSNVNDAEWATIEPRLPQRNRLGRPPKTEMRSIVNALLYMVRTGCQWRQLPHEFPPFTTVQHYF